MTTRRICATALLGLLFACEEHTTEPDQAVEACEHLKETTTMISGSATPPTEVMTHKRFEVTLLDGGIGGKTGTVSFQVSKAGHLLLFLTAATTDVPVKVMKPNGSEVVAAEIKTGGPCAELKAWYEYDAAVGPHTIVLGGTTTTASSVGLVIETEEHAH
jgi:hypothetical protein